MQPIAVDDHVASELKYRTRRGFEPTTASRKSDILTTTPPSLYVANWYSLLQADDGD